MKRYAIAALAAFIALAAATCGGKRGDVQYTGQDGTNSYKLTVSKGSAKAAESPATGDAYALVIYSGTTASGTEIGKSKGKIEVSNNGKTIKLNGSGIKGSVSMTINGDKITAIKGTINVNRKPANLNLSLKPVTSGGDSKSDKSGSDTKSGNSGGDSKNGGTFTITDIPSKLNGKYAIVVADTPDPNAMLVGIQSWKHGPGGANDVTVTLSPISKGKVSIPLWKGDMWTGGDNVDPTKYTGNDTSSMVMVVILNSPTMKDFSEDVATSAVVDKNVFQNVTFSSGGASKSWKDDGMGDMLP
jgi:hypothetical protein